MLFWRATQPLASLTTGCIPRGWFEATACQTQIACVHMRHIISMSPEAGCCRICWHASLTFAQSGGSWEWWLLATTIRDCWHQLSQLWSDLVGGTVGQNRRAGFFLWLSKSSTWLLGPSGAALSIPYNYIYTYMDELQKEKEEITKGKASLSHSLTSILLNSFS